jgi:hypothetical protein
MTGELRVETIDLRAKALQIEALQWSNPLTDNPIVVPPDQLHLSKTAVDNLKQNASFLYQNQDYGHREGTRLAESLRSVAQAYDDVDAAAKANLDGVGPPVTPVMPKTNAIPAPTPPAPMGAPLGLSSDEYLDVEKAQQALSMGDHGASLREAAAAWTANGTALQTSAETFKVKIQDWEGQAAEQAYGKFNEYGNWLSELGTTWQSLAGEAMRISDAHVKTLIQHTEVYQQYEALKTQMATAIANGGSAAHSLGLQMEQLQKESEEIRHGYAGEAAPHPVEPGTPPPPSGVPTTPVSSNGDPRRTTIPDRNAPSSPGGPGQAPPGGAPAPAMPPGGASPMSAGAQPAGVPEGSGAPSGGGSPSGGGAPSGGGSPSGGGAPGGGTPGGLPGGGKDIPRLPTDPSLRPAAADAGGGAGGGSGGGGVPPMPLQPNVGGVAVGPGASAGGPGAAAGPTAAGSSAGMSGMGGMPMHGAGHGQGGGKERKRTPGLAPDEDVYSEDRPWTEAVIGNRRRKDVQDNKESS